MNVRSDLERAGLRPYSHMVTFRFRNEMRVGIRDHALMSGFLVAPNGWELSLLVPSMIPIEHSKGASYPAVLRSYIADIPHNRNRNMPGHLATIFSPKLASLKGSSTLGGTVTDIRGNLPAQLPLGPRSPTGPGEPGVAGTRLAGRRRTRRRA